MSRKRLAITAGLILFLVFEAVGLAAHIHVSDGPNPDSPCQLCQFVRGGGKLFFLSGIVSIKPLLNIGFVRLPNFFFQSFEPVQTSPIRAPPAR